MQPSDPPLIELVIGVQFTTALPVYSRKLVLFWNEHLRKDYPLCKEAPSLDDSFEKFGEENGEHERIQFSIEQLPQLRYQVSNSDTGRMVQIQATRLVANWVKQSTEYPRFSAIHADLRATFQLWQDYAAANEIGEVVPNQWELCYVNLIPQGPLWQTPRDWHRISNIFAAETDGFPPLKLEDRRSQWRLLMPERVGRITLTAQPARNKDGIPTLQLSILARGPAGAVDEVHERLELAHTCILELFGRLATDDAKAHWGLKS